jgi:hypothetical protein
MGTKSGLDTLGGRRGGVVGVKMVFGPDTTVHHLTVRRTAPLAAAELAEDAVQPDAEVREQPCHTADA